MFDLLYTLPVVDCSTIITGKSQNRTSADTLSGRALVNSLDTSELLALINTLNHFYIDISAVKSMLAILQYYNVQPTLNECINTIIQNKHRIGTKTTVQLAIQYNKINPYMVGKLCRRRNRCN